MSFYNYIFGPKLYMEYRGVPEAQVKPKDDLICIINMQLHFISFLYLQRKMYEPGAVEKFGEQILSTVGVGVCVVYMWVDGRMCF